MCARGTGRPWHIFSNTSDPIYKVSAKPTSTIFLIGMPGCGKSHLGERAAQKMKIAFIDFDRYLEEKEGNTIAQIFEKAGEDGFRSLERKYLKELTKKKARRFIALGGGTPCFFDNMQLINKNGLSVYLRAPLADLYKRLLPEAHKRPLLKDKSGKQLMTYLKELLKNREPFYKQADIILDIINPDANAFTELLKQRRQYL